VIDCKTSKLLVISLSLFGFGTTADQISLGLPINCAMSTDCFVQNYFDHASGEEAVDHTCGPLVL
jgi:hypothetical protein